MKAITDITVLLVDDQKGIRLLARNALEDAGVCDIREAKSGEDALKILREEPGIDLVISDWNMQPVDGLELLAAMRADERLANMPFIIMTGQFSEDQERAATDAGADSLVTKPFTSDDVKQQIERVLTGAA